VALFGRKKRVEEEVPAPPLMGTPTNLVLQMRQQGLTDNQIVQSLQKEGYTSTQIFDALSQADIKKTIQPAEQQPPGPEAPPGYPQQAPMQGEMMPRQAPAPMPQPAPMPGEPMPRQAPAPGVSREQIEEVAETIVEEKWTEIEKGINKIITWKEDTEEKIIKIEADIANLSKRFSELHTGVLGKISGYEKGIRDVGTEVKAMQEVFKKTLPKFTENVAALERLTKKKSVKK
jgi:hypothetical protein